MKITKGQIVKLKKEWRDDDQTVFVAIDDMEKDRFTVMAMIGFKVNPTYVVTKEMIGE